LDSSSRAAHSAHGALRSLSTSSSVAIPRRDSARARARWIVREVARQRLRAVLDLHNTRGVCDVRAREKRNKRLRCGGIVSPDPGRGRRGFASQPALVRVSRP
jgi:hypothetical protein